MHNINLVTPEHVVPQVVEALSIALERGLSLPVIYNTSGYDCLPSLELLSGLVDIYMPDFKVAVSAILLCSVWSLINVCTFLYAEGWQPTAYGSVSWCKCHLWQACNQGTHVCLCGTCMLMADRVLVSALLWCGISPADHRRHHADTCLLPLHAAQHSSGRLIALRSMPGLLTTRSMPRQQ